jgi:hypothetical protein
MSPAVQKGPLGDLHANGPSPREERVEATPRRLTQGATARLGDLALLRSILLRMAKRVTAALRRPFRVLGVQLPWRFSGKFSEEAVTPVSDNSSQDDQGGANNHD